MAKKSKLGRKLVTSGLKRKIASVIGRIFLSQKLYGEKYPINQNLLLTFLGNIYQKQLLFT